MQQKLANIAKILIPAIILVFAALLFVYQRDLADTKLPSKILSPIGNSFSFMSFLKPKHTPKKIVYGYLPYWSIEDSKNIQLDKLTDISYFGIYLKEDGNFLNTLEDGTSEHGILNWHNNVDLDELLARARNTGVRVSLTIISHTDEVSDKFLSCKECWNTFINNVEVEMDSKKIKDLNLNFEYVEFTNKETAAKYTEFVDFTNKKLDQKYGNSIVTVATFADSLVKDRVTDVAALGKVADLIFIMAYDFHRPDSDNAGPVAPIDGKGTYSDYDLRTMINDYVAVVPPSKLLMGMPYYGYNWVVKEGKPNSERIPGTDETGYSQSQTYAKIMDTILEKKPELKWDDLGKTPYFTYVSDETGATREVYFDNEKSLEEKYKLVNENGLGGIGIWALGYDGGYQELWQLIYNYFIK